VKVLVTSGATREPIDSVRFISNLSSGRTGAAICEALAARGFDVTQLHGIDSAQAPRAARREAFGDHASLDAALRRLLADGAYDAVIQAAAVGDYSVAETAPGAKLASGQERVLHLRPNPKIIDRIRSHAQGRPLTLIGFKLTHDPDPDSRARAARVLMQRSGADYVVQNDVSTLGDVASHEFLIHSRDGAEPARCAGRAALAAALAALLERPGARSPA
jgi:phosphopantothenoylcysteine decarboxylase/phosphopantothenate--cysteine ligase